MRRRVPGLLLLVAAAGLVRLAAARDDLWLDEIWSLSLASKLHRAQDVFTSLHHDNNHYLVTLWMFLLGENVAGFWYRLPSVLAGTATVALAALAGRRLGRTTAGFAAALTAFSLPLVVYASEARGYALAVCCALAAYLVLARLLDRGKPADALLFGAVSVLGILSHLTFVHVLLAAGIWSLSRLAVRPASIRGMSPVLGLAFTPPVLALAALWALDLKELTLGGGDPTPALEPVERMASLLLGRPNQPIFLAVPAAALLVAAGLQQLSRSGRTDWIFLLAATVSPALALAVPGVSFRHPRYLLIGVPFAFLAVAALLDALWDRGTPGRALAAAGLAAVLLGDARQLASFLRDGRGHYAEAVRFMASGASGPEATVRSDQDFRNGLVVRYYARRLALPRPVVYLDQGEAPGGVPDWILTHSGSPSPVHPDSLTDAEGNRYVFEKGFPFATLSGFSWSLFRSEARTPP